MMKACQAALSTPAWKSSRCETSYMLSKYDSFIGYKLNQSAK